MTRRYYKTQGPWGQERTKRERGGTLTSCEKTVRTRKFELGYVTGSRDRVQEGRSVRRGRKRRHLHVPPLRIRYQITTTSKESPEKPSHGKGKKKIESNFEKAKLNTRYRGQSPLSPSANK